MNTKPAVPAVSAPDPRPLPATMTVGDALGAHLAEIGVDVASYSADTYEIALFGRTITLPNIESRKTAVPLHDLHHIATGYRTDLAGEAEIAVWELRAGCRSPTVYAINVAAAILGLVLAPSRVLRALRDAKGARTLYRQSHGYEALLRLTVGELRALLGVPAGGIARERLHVSAPAGGARPAAA